MTEDEERPWRHASRLQLRNMVSTATARWQKAMREDEIGRAALIRKELEPVSRELDARARVRSRA